MKIISFGKNGVCRSLEAVGAMDRTDSMKFDKVRNKVWERNDEKLDEGKYKRSFPKSLVSHSRV